MAIYKDNNKTKDGRSWYFKVYKEDFSGNLKAYKSKRYLTKKEAQAEEALFILKRDDPTHKLFSLVAKDYFEEYKKFGKISTYNSYYKAFKTHIEPFFQNMNIDTITTKQIRIWHDYMENKTQLSSSGKKCNNKPLSINYMNKVNAVLCNIFTFGIRNYQLEYNPAKMYGNFQAKRGEIKKDNKKFITFDEFQRIVAVIDEPLWYTYFNFLFYTGTRKGEAMCAHWRDIDFKNNKIVSKNTLQVDIQGGFFETTNKINEEKIIMMNDELYTILYNYKQEQMKYTDFSEDWYVFGGPRPISKTTADRKKEKYFKMAGVELITNHQFRHSLSTVLIKEYVKQQQKNNAKIDKYAFLQALATRNGHTVETMLKYYAHLFPDTEQQQVIDLLNNLKK